MSNTDLDAVDREDGTALHRAVRLGDLEAATLLLDRGASVDSRFRGQTPLHLISPEKGIVGTELLKLLLSRGAAADARDTQGTTLLMNLAMWDPARKRTLPTATTLLDAGADPRARDDYGSTPLHYAARASTAELVTLLLARGADAHARSWSYLGGILGGNKTALEEATEAPVKLLLRAATATSQPEAAPSHGTTIEAVLPQLAPYRGTTARIGDLDALSHLRRDGEHRLIFFAWNEIAPEIQQRLRSAHCKRFADTMIPFALVGPPSLHDGAPTLASAAPRNVYGTLFWDFALGREERCPIWYWASPGNAVTGLTLVGESLEALGVQVLGPSGRWARVSRRGSR